MKCEEIQPKLSAYLDDFLPAADSVRIIDHLDHCPLCRLRVSVLQDVRNALRSLPRPQVPPEVVSSVRNAVAAKLTTRVSEFPVFLLNGRSAPLRTWLTSYAVGACASLLLSFSLLWTLSMPLPAGRPAASDISKGDAAVSTSADGGDSISARDYAMARSTVAAESPSVNPHGTLVELTKALVNGDLRDDEVVVVADVYENGSAHITEVVEPSRDRNAVNELAKALDGDSIYTPFVPAAFDRRSDTVRVVFKIQSVDVDTRERPRSRRKSL